MSNEYIDGEHGHWLLSKMGKKVLRPGGKELTLKLLSGLEISDQDRVIEFAPGMGYTAMQVLKSHPQSYIGVELNKEAAGLLRKKLNTSETEIITGNASKVDLPNQSADKLYGEAMLTMHANHRKTEIIREAHRLLSKGGLYGVHELCLMPDDLDEEVKAKIQKELAQTIRINARPLTQNEWKGLLEDEGFKVKKIMTHPMMLLEVKRVIDDEGFFRALKIGFNISTHPKAKKRILEMRGIFQKYKKEMSAVAIIAERI